MSRDPRRAALASNDALVAAFGLLMLAEYAVTGALSVHLVSAAGESGVALLALRFVPPAIFGTSASRVITVLGPWRTMRLVVLVRMGALVVAVGVLAAGLGLAWLLVALSVDAAAAILYRPAQATVLPGLCSSVEALTAVVARTSSAKTAGQVTGMALGAFVAAKVNMTAACAGAAVLVAAGAALGDLASRGRPTRTGRRAERSRRVSAPFAWIVVVAGSARSFLRGVWTALAVLAAVGPLGMGASGVAVLALAVGVGGLASLAVTRRVAALERLGVWVGASLAGGGASLMAIGANPGAVAACVIVVGLGFAIGVLDLAVAVLLARLTDHWSVARVSAQTESAKLFAEGAGAALAPALAAATGVDTALVAAGGAISLLAVALVPTVRSADRVAGQRVGMVRTLRRAWTLRSLPLEALELLAAAAQPENHGAGAQIIRQGGAADGFRVMMAGEAQVRVDGRPVRSLEAGNGFGDIALLHDTPRTAEVIATSDVETLLIDPRAFLLAVTGEPSPLARGRESGAPRSPEEAVTFAPSLALLDEGERARLAEEAGRRLVAAGDVVVARGEPGGILYVILGGIAIVTDAVGGRSAIGRGAEIGAIAALHAVPHVETVTAYTAMELAAIDVGPGAEVVGRRA